MCDTAGSATAPPARPRNRRRGRSAAFTLSGWLCSLASIGRRRVRRLFDTIAGVSTLVLRRSLLLTSPSVFESAPKRQLLCLNAQFLDDRPPFLDTGLHKRAERLRCLSLSRE